MSTEVQQFEPVPTPRQFVGEVYALLARLMGTAAPDRAEEANTNGGGDLGPLATDEALIRRIYEESEEAHRRLLKRLAESADEWVLASELASDLGLHAGAKSLAGSLGALGKRSKHRYENRRAFYSEWDHIKGETRHMMPSPVAKVIEKL
jgi:hypothetical protein